MALWLLFPWWLAFAPLPAYVALALVMMLDAPGEVFSDVLRLVRRAWRT